MGVTRIDVISCQMKIYGTDQIVYTPNNIPQILTWVKPNSRVLEFGPGMGYMTRYMKEQLHCHVVAVEINPVMAETIALYAEQVIVSDIDTGSWEQELQGQSFDYVLFADVLEHLRNPLGTLETVVRYGDCILTSVPNIGHSSIILSLLDGEFEYQNMGLLDDTHIHFFTRKSLVDMTSQCGLICTDNKDTILMYPSSSEFHKYYSSHIGASWAIAKTPDSAVYQFVDRWEKNNDTHYRRKPYSVSFVRYLKIIVSEVVRRVVFSSKYLRENKRIRRLWQQVK